MPEQLRFFHRKAQIEYPKVLPTADSLGQVEADDGQHYYVKDDAHGRPVRASEWISTHVAEMVGISAPSAAPIEMSSGRTVFGSRRISGASDAVTTQYLILDTGANAQFSPVGLSSILSSIYALDMFLFNDDRHFGNYLTHDDNGVRRMYAYDFSRAMFWHWPWVAFPVGCNTRACGALWMQRHSFDMVSANNTLDRLDALPEGEMSNILNRMPSDWLSAQLSGEFLQWWGAPAKTARVQQLRQGFIDGTLL